MAKSKSKPERTTKDDEGNVVEAVFVGGYFPAPLKDAMEKLGQSNDRKLIAEIRQACREHLDRHKENGK